MEARVQTQFDHLSLLFQSVQALRQVPLRVKRVKHAARACVKSQHAIGPKCGGRGHATARD